MDNALEKYNNLYGLIGRNISYSFSAGYFQDKFASENIQSSHYTNFDIASIDTITAVFKNHNNIKGCNVTIPYKEQIIPYLDELSSQAKAIGAVNTIVFKNGKKIGYNTDCIGFEKPLVAHLKPHHKKALILGTGGAAKAVMYVLKQLDIPFQIVSRSATENQIMYSDITASMLNEYHIIINCTPLGTHPNIEECPPLPYQAITQHHLLYDLIYNPPLTKFLSYGKTVGATILNGKQMLINQAEAAWKLWNS